MTPAQERDRARNERDRARDTLAKIRRIALSFQAGALTDRQVTMAVSELVLRPRKRATP